MTDELGATVTWSASYYPFGEATTSGTNTHQFTGKELDVEMGLNYFCQRYYDSQIGRFMTLDNWTNLPNDERLLSYGKYLSWTNYQLKYTPQAVKEFKKRFLSRKSSVPAYDSLSCELLLIFPQISASLIDSRQLQNKLRMLSGYLYQHQLNGYLYCNNNPLKYIDPTGNGVNEREIFQSIIMMGASYVMLILKVPPHLAIPAVAAIGLAAGLWYDEALAQHSLAAMGWIVPDYPFGPPEY